MNLAWFSPWPPQPSGIAGRSAELVSALAGRGHGVDVFLDERDPVWAAGLTRAPSEPPAPGEVRLQSAHDFVWRAARRQYDLPVYALGNSRLHEYIWPYLFQYPGLALLHDGRLHHARGRALLHARRFADYRAEFVWNHPHLSPDLAELGIRGFAGPYYYDWPMIRATIEASRLTACHSRGACEELRQASPGRPIEYIALGEGPDAPDLETARRGFRQTHGIDPEAVVFGVHGALTAEKRVPQILRGFAATRPWLGRARLLLAGRADPALGLDRMIDDLGLRDVTDRAEHPDDAGFDAAIAASDVTLNLRWPTARETSGPWVRSLAFSRATIIVDLQHQPVPALDPRTWRLHAPAEDPDSGADARAAAVAIDILDEEHSLRLAMRRLAVDEPLRRRLGACAREYWEQEHTVGRMVEDAERAIAHAAALPAPSPALPAHLRPDPLAWGRALVADFGLTPDDMM